MLDWIWLNRLLQFCTVFATDAMHERVLFNYLAQQAILEQDFCTNKIVSNYFAE